MKTIRKSCFTEGLEKLFKQVELKHLERQRLSYVTQLNFFKKKRSSWLHIEMLQESIKRIEEKYNSLLNK